MASGSESRGLGKCPSGAKRHSEKPVEPFVYVQCAELLEVVDRTAASAATIRERASGTSDVTGGAEAKLAGEIL